MILSAHPIKNKLLTHNIILLSLEVDVEDDNDGTEDEEASAGVEVEDESVVEAVTLGKSSKSTRLDVIVRRMLWYLYL